MQAYVTKELMTLADALGQPFSAPGDPACPAILNRSAQGERHDAHAQ
jgi:hypothetical protein